MDAETPDQLAAAFAQDEDAGFALFRDLFFAALERRRLAECRDLLAALCRRDAARLRQECRYHQAILHVEQGALDPAERLLRDLLAEQPPPAPPLQARALLELGYVLDELSQWDEAERLYHAALARYQQNGDPLGQAKARNNLGVLARFRVEQRDVPPERRSDHLRTALAHHQAALALAQAAGDPWEAAKSFHGQGMAHSLLHDPAAAEAAFQEHIARCQALDNSGDQAISLYDLAAHVYLPQGRRQAAHAALAQAIPRLQQAGDDLSLAEALTHLGNLHAAQDNPAQAQAAYAQAVGRAESLRARVTTPTARAGTRALLDAVYTAPLTHHLQQGDAAAAFNAGERARARTLSELLSSPDIRPRSAVAPGLLAQRAALRARLEQAYAADPPPAEPAELAAAALADLERRIELADPALAGLTALAPLTVDQVQARLPAHAALLSYVGDADDRLWGVVVTRHDVQAQPIPTPSIQWLRAYLADHIDGSRRGILTPAPGVPYLEPPRQLFPPLYRTLLAPFEPWLAGAQTVYLVPHGPLHYLPIGALTPDLAAPPPLLAAGRRLVYAPSATVLLDYCHTRPPSSRRGILAVAPQGDQLRLTQGAARRLAEQGQTRHGRSAALLGQAATRRALLDQAGGYAALCFLGHGLFDPTYPMASRLQLADGPLLAGDILAGLRLDADLVALAACETGRSQVLRGDEILGLTRALLYAGAPSLLVTLWRVHEAPTRLLVERFFATLDPAAPDPAAALAAAQGRLRALTVAEARAAMTAWDELSPAAVETQIAQLWQMTRRDRPLQDDAPLFAHPFFWSPYILVGDQPPGG